MTNPSVAHIAKRVRKLATCAEHCEFKCFWPTAKGQRCLTSANLGVPRQSWGSDNMSGVQMVMSSNLANPLIDFTWVKGFICLTLVGLGMYLSGVNGLSVEELIIIIFTRFVICLFCFGFLVFCQTPGKEEAFLTKNSKLVSLPIPTA